MSKNLFKGPQLINIHTNRFYWHAGAGKDESNVFDRLGKEIDILGKKAEILDFKIKKRIENLWKKHSEKQ